MKALLRRLWSKREPRRCPICGGRLLQEANTPAEARRSGVILGDLCEHPHPILSINGLNQRPEMP
jgi:hypothetical protein